MSAAGLPGDLARLAWALVQLDDLEPQITPEGAPVVIGARRESLRLVATMLQSVGVAAPAKVVGSRGSNEAATLLAILDQMAISPAAAVLALARVESDVATRATDAPIAELLRLPVGSGYEKQWRFVLVRATACRATLEAVADPHTPRRVEWALTRDAAAIGMTIGRLDESLLPALGAITDEEGRRQLATAVSSHLRAAAVLLADTASRHGAQQTVSDVNWSTRSAPSVTSVHKPEQLVQAAHAVHEQLRLAGGLSPALIIKVAASQRHVIQLAERVLDATGPGTTRPVLARDLAAPLREVCTTQHPQVLALRPPQGFPETKPHGLAASRALAAQVDVLYQGLRRAHTTLDAHPKAAHALRDAVTELCSLVPPIVRATFDAAHRELLAGRWASTVGPQDYYAQPYSRDGQPPRLISALAAAATTAWRADDASAPSVGFGAAARLCGVDPPTIHRLLPALQAIGATPPPPQEWAPWSIPHEALTAIGLTPAAEQGPLGIREAARACGVSTEYLKARRDQLRSFGANVPTGGPSSGWQIPVSALLSVGLLPAQLTDAEAAASGRTDAAVSAHQILAELEPPAIAHVAELGAPGSLAGPRVVSRQRHALLDRLSTPTAAPDELDSVGSHSRPPLPTRTRAAGPGLA